MTNNALLRAVSEDSATRRCMYRVACSVCRDQAHKRARAALLNVRSLTIDKLDDDGCKNGDRPLGMGECESRLFCGAAMQQEREWMHNHFTTMLPEDKHRHEATVLQAEEALRQARSELEAAESALAADQVAGYRARVVFAEGALEIAHRPPIFCDQLVLLAQRLRSGLPDC